MYFFHLHHQRQGIQIASQLLALLGPAHISCSCIATNENLYIAVIFDLCALQFMNCYHFCQNTFVCQFWIIFERLRASLTHKTILYSQKGPFHPHSAINYPKLLRWIGRCRINFSNYVFLSEDAIRFKWINISYLSTDTLIKFSAPLA